ncbi:alpha/beta fold hydrolase [Amycolatopsis panacis]|uniref:alpha/beta fold hydrolase n=1 Tax=Amycolatopsis panacis TaxID=2340917 RepID=UPI0011C4081E|nr:alpha/beta hydrolase [Amycolatopsis panacis]
MGDELHELGRANTLSVPGARLRYRVRGSGPVLLLIPGGPASASMYDDVAPLLAEHYSVITYDPRGLGASTLDDPNEDIAVATQADDVHRLLRTVTDEPAYVFATSGGCATGLALAVNHAPQVRTLVAHEPSLSELLPDVEERRAHNEDIFRTARTAGVSAALHKFLPAAGFRLPDAPDPKELAAITAMREHLEEFFTPRNLEVFFGPMWRPLAGYAPDLDALRATPTRIVIGIGTTSEGQFAHRSTLLLAAELSQRPVVFPGDHGGMMGVPDEFTECLLKILAEQ